MPLVRLLEIKWIGLDLKDTAKFATNISAVTTQRRRETTLSIDLCGNEPDSTLRLGHYATRECRCQQRDSCLDRSISVRSIVIELNN